MAMKQTDILIIGGGAAGLTLAGLLGPSGLDICIVDPYPPQSVKKTAAEPSSRTVALMNSSLNVLRQAGIWEQIAPFSNPLEAMRIIDNSRPVEEPVEVEFPASDIGLEQFGYNIPVPVLRAALFENVKAQKNIRILKTSLKSFETNDNGVQAHFENGKSVQARLIVGADGRSSTVREMAGIETSRKNYDQVAITCLINHSRNHQNISTEFHYPAGPTAFVPLPGNQSAIVWVERPERAQEILALGKEAFETTLQERSNDLLGGITLETKLQSWPLCTITAKSLTAQRCALIAEAAHVMSPITAQGLNLSLRDVAALAEEIMDGARLGLDIGSTSILKAYEKRRRVDIETRVFGVDHMNRIVSTDHKLFKHLRRAGLQSLDTLPPVKTLAMHVGLAPQMDMGRLAKGEAL